MAKSFADICSAIDRQTLVELFLKQKKSKAEIIKTLNICLSTLNKLLAYYEIANRESIYKSDRRKEIRQKPFESIKKTYP